MAAVPNITKPRRRPKLRTAIPPGRKRAYSRKEAERIARYLPLERTYSPFEAAFAVSQYLNLDPAFWLDQAGLAGMSCTMQGGYFCQLYPEADQDAVDFLKVWLNISGGKDAVVALLQKRAEQAEMRA